MPPLLLLLGWVLRAAAARAACATVLGSLGFPAALLLCSRQERARVTSGLSPVAPCPGSTEAPAVSPPSRQGPGELSPLAKACWELVCTSGLACREQPRSQSRGPGFLSGRACSRSSAQAWPCCSCHRQIYTVFAGCLGGGLSKSGGVPAFLNYDQIFQTETNGSVGHEPGGGLKPFPFFFFSPPQGCVEFQHTRVLGLSCRPPVPRPGKPLYLGDLGL